MVVFLHGLLQCIEGLKAVSLYLTHKADNLNISQLTFQLLQLMEAISIIAGLGLMISGIYFLLKRERWWRFGLIALAVSQFIITVHWPPAVYDSLTNIIIFTGGWLAYHQHKSDHSVMREINDLINSQENLPTIAITLDSIGNLPVSVQKWLVRSNVIGTEKVQRVRLRQQGMMRSKPNSKWMNMEAEQYITIDNPGFLWRASIDAGFCITINGRDQFKDGHGTMLITVLNAITITDSDGREIDQGAMMRYLAEIIWSPSTALRDYIRWEYVTEDSARATMQLGDQVVSGVFTFNRRGDVMGFEGKRYGDFNDQYSLETWHIDITGYKDFNGYRIAHKSEVIWKLKSGDFKWLKLEVTDLEYNFPVADAKEVTAYATIQVAVNSDNLMMHSKI